MRTAVDARIQKAVGENYEPGKSVIIDQAQMELAEFFAGARKSFDIPFGFYGTDFQKRIWNALLEIPFGSTTNYKDLSKSLGDVKAIRAVASANGANAISIIVPCHRVIGSNGDLVGYAGGVTAKKKLLALEGVYLAQPELNLFPS